METETTKQQLLGFQPRAGRPKIRWSAQICLISLSLGALTPATASASGSDFDGDVAAPFDLSSDVMVEPTMSVNPDARLSLDQEAVLESETATFGSLARLAKQAVAFSAHDICSLHLAEDFGRSRSKTLTRRIYRDAATPLGGFFVGLVMHTKWPAETWLQRLFLPTWRRGTIKRSLLGWNATSVFRDGMGCTTLIGRRSSTIRDVVRSIPFTKLPAPELPSDVPWPLGAGGINDAGYDEDALATIRELVDELGDRSGVNAVLVSHRGNLIAERYSNARDVNSLHLGRSMSKTVGAIAMGIAQANYEGFDIDADIDEWLPEMEPGITPRHLLHMASGIEWNESHVGKGNLTEMLFDSWSTADYVVSLPRVSEPGATYNYSTGDAQLLAEALTRVVGDGYQDAYNFYQEALFHRVGVASALLPPDTSGTPISGGNIQMTARDWLRMGQLMLQDGHWDGEEVVPAAWVSFMEDRSPAAWWYGGQMWQATFDTDAGRRRGYYFNGIFGQDMIYFPESRGDGDIVVLVLSEEPDRERGWTIFQELVEIAGKTYVVPAPER